MVLHLSHLDNNKTYVRMLLINSSAFIIIITSKLISALIDLGINTSICSWILDLPTNRSQYVGLDNHTSSTFTLNSSSNPSSPTTTRMYMVPIPIINFAVSQPTGSRSSSWQCGVPATTWASTPRTPNNSLQKDQKWYTHLHPHQ